VFFRFFPLPSFLQSYAQLMPVYSFPRRFLQSLEKAERGAVPTDCCWVTPLRQSQRAELSIDNTFRA
jgi:hypothetical protein